MEAKLIEELIEGNKPFRIETAAGRVFDVSHRDFIAFSRRKTSVIITYDENGDELLAMREQMFARGPDGGGQWIAEDGRVGLANRRLSIIDVSPAGAQPMFNADRSLAITFNGEIYNYAELRQKLIREGRRFQSHCDTE